MILQASPKQQSPSVKQLWVAIPALPSGVKSQEIALEK